jgi:hypothetical protein
MRNNMKGGELALQERLMLRKRAVIESVNDELKNICRIDRTYTAQMFYKLYYKPNCGTVGI